MPTDLRRGWEGVGEASPDGTCWIRGSGSQGIKHALVPYEVRFFFAQCRHHQESKSRYVLGPFRVWALKLLVCGAVHPIYTLSPRSLAWICSSGSWSPGLACADTEQFCWQASVMLLQGEACRYLRSGQGARRNSQGYVKLS